MDRRLAFRRHCEMPRGRRERMCTNGRRAHERRARPLRAHWSLHRIHPRAAAWGATSLRALLPRLSEKCSMLTLDLLFTVQEEPPQPASDDYDYWIQLLERDGRAALVEGMPQPWLSPPPDEEKPPREAKAARRRTTRESCSSSSQQEQQPVPPSATGPTRKATASATPSPGNLLFPPVA